MGNHIERRTLLKSLAATPVLLSPLAAGCADHGSSTSAGTLNIGQISDSVAFFPLFVAEEKGYFKDEGIKLGDRPRLGTGAKVAAALKSGSIDLGAGVLTDAFNLEKTGGTAVRRSPPASSPSTTSTSSSGRSSRRRAKRPVWSHASRRSSGRRSASPGRAAAPRPW